MNLQLLPIPHRCPTDVQSSSHSKSRLQKLYIQSWLHATRPTLYIGLRNQQHQLLLQEACFPSPLVMEIPNLKSNTRNEQDEKIQDKPPRSEQNPSCCRRFACTGVQNTHMTFSLRAKLPITAHRIPMHCMQKTDAPPPVAQAGWRL